MRAASLSTIATIALVAGTAAPVRAQALTTTPNTSVTCVVRAVVSSFVRLVPVPADPSTGGLATFKVVTNDPQIRASLGGRLTPEMIGPAGIAYETVGSGRGGEAAIEGHLVAGPTTVRYTVTTP